MWDISELNLSLLFLSEIDKYVKSMFEFSDAENIQVIFLFSSGLFSLIRQPTTIPRKNNKISSKETLKSDLSKI